MSIGVPPGGQERWQEVDSPSQGLEELEASLGQHMCPVQSLLSSGLLPYVGIFRGAMEGWRSLKWGQSLFCLSDISEDPSGRAATCTFTGETEAQRWEGISHT